MFSSVLPRLVLSITYVSSSISVGENEIGRGEKSNPYTRRGRGGAGRRSPLRAARATRRRRR
jgi:hypothetical protein